MSSGVPERRKVSKAGRPKRARPGVGVDAEPAKPAVKYTEEIVTVEEQSSILVRFPCFDFFRNVHICEGMAADPPSPEAQGEDVQASSLVFRPEALVFVPGTIDTDRPLAVLNAGLSSEMHFAGHWEECTGRNGLPEYTNRAIVHLHLADDKSRAEKDAAVIAPVPSIFASPETGLSADEQRAKKEQEAQQEWVYDSIDVPTAVLVMHLVK